MVDAEKALRINKYNTKAIVAKAEALYNLGHFEKALVQFERGWRMRQDPEINAGIVKCRDVILNTVGSTAKEYDADIVEKVIQQMKEIELEKKKSELEKQKAKKKNKNKTKGKKGGKDPDQLLLGKMQEDVRFLEDFLKFQKSQQITTDYQVFQKNIQLLETYEMIHKYFLCKLHVIIGI